MATIVPTNPIESVNLSTLAYTTYLFGDLFSHDLINEFSYSGHTVNLSGGLTEVHAVDESLNYISDSTSVFYYVGDIADFNTNITIGGGSAPVDPTKGIQYWG